MTAIKTVTLIGDQEQGIVNSKITSPGTDLEEFCAMVVEKMLDTGIVIMSGLVTVSFCHSFINYLCTKNANYSKRCTTSRFS